MNARPVYLALLAGALVLFVLSRTRRGEVAAVDAVEFVTVTAQRIEEAWRTTRGLRNRNPGNIDWIANPLQRWRGMVAKEERGRFAIFDSDANGVRAIGGELRASARRGARTVRDFIAGIPLADGTRWDAWAPPQENDTDAYVRAVAKALHVGADEVIELENVLPEFVAAIIKHENGVQPYATSDIAQWVNA